MDTPRTAYLRHVRSNLTQEEHWGIIVASRISKAKGRRFVEVHHGRYPSVGCYGGHNHCFSLDTIQPKVDLTQAN